MIALCSNIQKLFVVFMLQVPFSLEYYTLAIFNLVTSNFHPYAKYSDGTGGTQRARILAIGKQSSIIEFYSYCHRNLFAPKAQE